MTLTLPLVEDHVQPIPLMDEDELASLKSKRDSLLGVEAFARAELSRRIQLGEVGIHSPQAQLLDPDVLAWRWLETIRVSRQISIPLPKFAILSLSSSGFFIGRDWQGSMNSQMPGVALSEYSDVADALTAVRFKDAINDHFLRYNWGGVIPGKAKDIIGQALQNFGHKDVYLLAEAPAEAWSYQTMSTPIALDPLILGHSGGRLFVVGSFDPTSLEDYIAQEWTA